MGWFDSLKSPKIKNSKRVISSNTPVGLWKKCSKCGEILQTSKLEENLNVCPYCQHNFRITAHQRIDLLIDKGTFKLMGESLSSNDPLGFVDKRHYVQRLEQAYEKTGLRDGTVCGFGAIDGRKVAIAVMDFYFMGGSMGVATGEKISFVFDEALKRSIPAIVVSCSGGARMQEGILSLMQLGKTSASRQRLKRMGVPYISVLTDPTTGGCAASFAMQGDINIAEPNALIGFAGPRVIEQTLGERLPAGFQRSEFLLEHGFIDRIVTRAEMKKEISFFIKMFEH